jgi:hypothetical protein
MVADQRARVPSTPSAPFFALVVDVFHLTARVTQYKRTKQVAQTNFKKRQTKELESTKEAGGEGKKKNWNEISPW